ncbi:MAG: hypothetical protein ABR515_01645 [Nitrososphaeraceae archaeon]
MTFSQANITVNNGSTPTLGQLDREANLQEDVEEEEEQNDSEESADSGQEEDE